MQMPKANFLQIAGKSAGVTWQNGAIDLETYVTKTENNKVSVSI